MLKITATDPSARAIEHEEKLMDCEVVDVFVTRFPLSPAARENMDIP